MESQSALVPSPADLKQSFQSEDPSALGAPRSRVDTSRWYVAATHRLKEAYAGEHLARQGFQAFLPRITRSAMIGRRRRDTLAPLFPGYIFVLLDIRSDHWSPINSTSGVRRLIGDRAGHPTPLPRGVVEDLQARCTNGVVTYLAPDLRPGDHVRLNGGAFSERLAQVIELSSQDRVQVLMEILGSSVRVSVPRKELIRSIPCPAGSSTSPSRMAR